MLLRLLHATREILSLDHLNTKFYSPSIAQLYDHTSSVNVTFHEQQDCGYGFPSLPLATRATGDVLEWFLSTSGEAIILLNNHNTALQSQMQSCVLCCN